MFTSWKVGKILGIDTFIHWSFWWFLLWIAISEASRTGFSAGLSAGFFIVLLFGCVYLHELGHAMAGRHYGIRTHDITLFPFGGVARLESIPEQPLAELVIALAGPAVNVVLAAILLTSLLLYGGVSHIWEVTPWALPFLGQLCVVNVGLVVFNMLPAFPMDGGRVLRALIATRYGHLQATEIAARIGRWLAAIMILTGLITFQFSLALVGLFVLMAGFSELVSVRMRSLNPADTPLGGPPFSYPPHKYRDVVDADEVRHIK